MKMKWVSVVKQWSLMKILKALALKAEKETLTEKLLSGNPPCRVFCIANFFVRNNGRKTDEVLPFSVWCSLEGHTSLFKYVLPFSEHQVLKV